MDSTLTSENSIFSRDEGLPIPPDQRAQTEQFRDLYDLAPSPMVTLDSAGRLVEINLAGTVLFEASRAVLAGADLRNWVLRADQSLFHEHVTKCRRGEGDSTDLRIRCGAGRVRHVRLLSRRAKRFQPPMADMSLESEQQWWYPTTLQDLTDERLAKAERIRLLNRERRSQRQSLAKDRFLANLSHELRTPLTPILAAVTGMLVDPALSREHREVFAMIQRNIEQESALIDDLLDMSRVVSGKLRVTLAPLELCGLLRDVVASFEGEAKDRDLTLRMDVPRDPAWVRGDAGRLRQVMTNLLTNAMKFTPAGGVIAVSLAVLGEGRVQVRVEDTGVGIDAAALTRVFEAFVQTDEGLVPQSGRAGLGLGLSISRGIVQMHGGEIVAHSDGPGRGSSFFITLPLAEGQAAGGQVVPGAERVFAEIRASGAAPVARPVRALLVEDDADSAAILRRLLQHYGFDVTVAGSARAAMELDGHPYDVLISDIGLPDATGHALMRGIRGRYPMTRGIALSGYATERDVRESREAGFELHLAKPVNFNTLLGSLDNLLGLSRG